jgi:hypothetical protein
MLLIPLKDNIELDVHKSNYVSIYAKQYDTNTRNIYISLLDNGVPITIPSNLIARVRGTKKDKTIFIKDCSIINNIVLLELKDQMLTVYGRVICDIGLYETTNTGNPKDDKLLSSSIFYINVDKAAYDENAVISSNEFLTLTELIAENRILRTELLNIKAQSKDLIIQMEQLIALGKLPKA